MSQKKQIEHQAILNFVKSFPEGVASLQIYTELPLRLPRRTLQRRLGELVARDLLSQQGLGPAVRYQCKKSALVAIQDRLSLPVAERAVAHYEMSFLEAYEPNQTFYLSNEILEYLHAIGHSPNPELQAGTYTKQIFNRLLIDLSWNSSRLEGNTYSLLQTEHLLHEGIAAPGKNPQETQMILNHKAALAFLVDNVEALSFSPYIIRNLHALLSHNLLRNPRLCGSLRQNPVGIGASTYRPLDVPQQIEMAFGIILQKAAQINNSFECAFFLMVQLPYLQAFEDVNKRVSRLAANIPLMKQNYCPLSFVEVSEQEYITGLLAVYEFNRIDYLRDVFVRAYEYSCAQYSQIKTTVGEPDPFRLLYSQQIQQTISHIVKASLDKTTADQRVQGIATEEIEAKDRARFIEVVETELLALHEGNIARYQLALMDFLKWQTYWN